MYATFLFSLLFACGPYLVLLFFSGRLLQPFQEIYKSSPRMIKIRRFPIRHLNKRPRGSVSLWNPLWSCLGGIRNDWYGSDAVQLH